MTPWKKQTLTIEWYLCYIFLRGSRKEFLKNAEQVLYLLIYHYTKMLIYFGPIYLSRKIEGTYSSKTSVSTFQKIQYARYMHILMAKLILIANELSTQSVSTFWYPKKGGWLRYFLRHYNVLKKCHLVTFKTL